MSLTLYYHPLSGYCHKVLVALYENGTEFERRVINLGDPKDRAELEALWPIVKFPVIRHGDRAVAETTIIIEYLDRHFPGPTKFIPADADTAMDVRFWDRVFDLYVNAPMQAIVWDRIRASKVDLAPERTMLEKAYAMIDKRMAGREWAGATHFSMADCAAAPALFYAGIVHPFPAGLTHLSEYFDRLMARPSVERVIDEARPFFKMFPFAEAIPPRFLG